MSSEYLLMGGPDGGKTTFAGGLIYYLEELSDLRRGEDYDITYPYNEEAVEDIIAEEMWYGEDKKYPEKSDADEYFIVKIILYRGTLLPEQSKIEIMDIPGEKQESARTAPTRSLFDGILSVTPGITSEQDQLVDTYRDTLKPKIESNTKLDPENNEWKELFKYRYLRSDSVILMLNLQKLQHTTDDPNVLDDTWLDIATSKQRTLILVIGCDVVNYDPSEFNGAQSSLLSNRVYDQELVDHIRTQLTDKQGRKISPLLTQVENVDSELSMFGVSVPAEDDERSERIETNADGDLKLQGYEQVVEWLRG